jgi:hypothetical protein
VQARYIGVLQAGLNLDFAQEPFREFGVSGKIRKQNFHGFRAVRDQVPDLVDLSHATGAQLTYDLIIADSVTDLKSHHFTSPPN